MVRWIFLAALSLSLFNEVTIGRSFSGDILRYALRLPIAP